MTGAVASSGSVRRVRRVAIGGVGEPSRHETDDDAHGAIGEVLLDLREP